MHFPHRTLLPALGAALLLASCQGNTSTSETTATGQPAEAAPTDTASVATPNDGITPALLARYPRRNLLTANAAGILPLLQELLVLEETANWPQPRRQQPAADLAVLRQRQRILAQVALVSTTVASVARTGRVPAAPR